MSAPSTAFRNVTKTYGATTAVADLTLETTEGEFLALVGHNGAGKTTLFKLLLGLIRPTEGTVRVLDCDPRDRNGLRRRGAVGYLPEAVSFDPAMTGQEVLRFYARLKHAGEDQQEALMETVGLTAAAGRRVRTYSKGMRQRLGLAQALLGAPRLLLLDEPTTGLDPAFRHVFYRLVEAERHRGATVIVATHALSEIETHAERIAVMNEGRLLASGHVHSLNHDADLPVRLRVQVRPCGTSALLDSLGPSVSVVERGEEFVLLACPAAEKMSVMRSIIAAADLVVDIETVVPSLEELYANLVPVGR